MLKKITSAVSIFGEFVSLSIKRVANLFEVSQHLVTGYLVILVIVLLAVMAFKWSDSSNRQDLDTIHNLSQALERASFEAYMKK